MKHRMYIELDDDAYNKLVEVSSGEHRTPSWQVSHIISRYAASKDKPKEEVKVSTTLPYDKVIRHILELGDRVKGLEGQVKELEGFVNDN